MDEALCYLSGLEALQRFRDRSLSPVELLDALIARAEDVEPCVNALSHRHFETAMRDARQAESRYLRNRSDARALEGLPLAVKEDTAVLGKPLTLGSLIYKDNIADHTSPAIQRLLEAGAIVHAQTTCPEFVWPWTCTSRLHGITRNPWNLDVTSGASSGGSAAALAAGTTTLATGSDSAGSIRMPASMCGVVGYKPPYGRNPQSAHLSLDMFMHLGPMTRCVADAALMQNVMSGHHPSDHGTVREHIELPLAGADVRGLKIAYSLDLDHHVMAADVLRNTQATLSQLRDLGCETVEVETPWAAEVFAKASYWGDFMYADEFSDALEKHPDLICDYTRVFARENVKTTQRMVHDLIKTAGSAWLNFGNTLETYDAFICPTTAATQIPAEGPDTEACVAINGLHLSPHDVVMTFYFDVFSRCPALAVPSGFADNAVPTGIQIVGRTYDDATVFRIAQALENLTERYDDAQTRPKLGTTNA